MAVIDEIAAERGETGTDEDQPLVGTALARWCHDNPNLAAATIEGLRIDAGKIVAKFERIFGKITATERYWLTRHISGHEY